MLVQIISTCLREEGKGGGGQHPVVIVIVFLKGPKHDNFSSEFLTPSKPIWVGNTRTGRKNSFVTFDARFDVFSAKIVFLPASPTFILSTIIFKPQKI